jgi:hypothetical protein
MLKDVAESTKDMVFAINIIKGIKGMEMSMFIFQPNHVLFRIAKTNIMAKDIAINIT